MNELLTLATFILGIATCVLSVLVALSFRKRRRALVKPAQQLTVALEWQLFGEAVIGLGTLIFATAAYVGILEHWSYAAQSGLRISMFLATSLTTIHLYRVAKRLQGS